MTSKYAGINYLAPIFVLMVLSLTTLLEKDATAIDPGRVIVISSNASVAFSAVGSGLAPPGHGLWSCENTMTFRMALSAKGHWNR